MRYSKEYKLECIRKYKNGGHIQDPGGCTHKTFHNKVLDWVRIYNKLGEAGLDHKKPELTIEDKIEICNRVSNGETMTEVAISYGRQEDFISKIYKCYLQHGVDGLISNKKKGRPPTMKEKEIDIKNLLMHNILSSTIANIILFCINACIHKFIVIYGLP